ncbi:MFS transporter [Amycolatopsis sp. NPDC059027]|uniref:MFS transporter n=1 Tax=Amycolatopsis sp. NPDC059027 TaxID=3346709 RepID=UPI00366F07ED
MRETGHRHFTSALASAEFRAMWLAEALSQVGDQLARVALALLVFGRTDSALLTALTYALTFLPSLLGGLLLSGLGDRFPRRTVIVVTDVLRACLAAAMAIPGLPLGALWGLVALLTLAGAPFKAAQLALLPDVLPPGRHEAGLGLRQVTIQIAQVAGFGLGGVLVTAVGPGAVLLFNGGTFLIGALAVFFGVRARPAARRDISPSKDGARPRGKPDRRIVAIVILSSLMGLLVVPEALAAPYANAAGAKPFMVGLLMAADPVGSVVGGWWAGRRASAPGARSVILPMALGGLPLAACAFAPGLGWTIALWAACGALCTVYMVRSQAVVMSVVDNARRATVMGRITTCLYTSQGLAMAGAGVAADLLGPAASVAIAGGLATVCAAGTMLVWRGARPRQAPAADLSLRA